ncbi:MAG: KpsF/GutQ family sugar-phosphate isomerase [Candidatus Omnitrophica bacterium]|nr:KpsF/GutQ family sugar-phosphate isomerase [Candidatus Omnitrophota bacterium]MDD5080388.1 KpsF/GutQ family sugar-phosphate isomerase [Candidatus Omnitrophota bacterium]MDD5440726.1 KpsF/GutQ family sugar-phosphate isomerase [Candidatus Omnitrophota bacterium]
MKINNKNLIKWANDVLDTEIDGIKQLKKRLNNEFCIAANILAGCKGKIVVTGMGKAGIIGQKFSATLSSTGSSSFWLHAAEAVHGDLGRISEDDVCVVLSYSGETEEIKNLIPFIKKIGAKIVAITGKDKSSLAKYSDSIVNVEVEREACPLGLAPTTSTTAMLAICDALSVVLQNLKGFKSKDFAFFHPRGSLGRKLLLKVADIMRSKKSNPVVKRTLAVRDVLVKITASGAGAASIVDSKGKLEGIFTDGDLRRNIEQYKDMLDLPVSKVMTKCPIVIEDQALASEAMKIMEMKKIDEIPVVDKTKKPVGMLDIQDLIAAGII